jgi:BolA protein
MSILETMKTKLQAALSPAALDVRDDSAAHYGHDGATPGQVSHVAIRVVSDAFDGKGRVERSRMVFGAIAEEIARVHAITSLVTHTPEEAKKAVR